MTECTVCSVCEAPTGEVDWLCYECRDDAQQFRWSDSSAHPNYDKPAPWAWLSPVRVRHE